VALSTVHHILLLPAQLLQHFHTVLKKGKNVPKLFHITEVKHQESYGPWPALSVEAHNIVGILLPENSAFFVSTMYRALTTKCLSEVTFSHRL